MAACAKILQSGKISAEMLKKGLMEKHGVDIESDPTLAAEFNNILNVFSLLPSHLNLIQDSPESSSCGVKVKVKPPRSGKDEITEITHSPTLIINDGWKKYGSKTIKGSPYQRGYYRCRYGMDCKAKIQVQQIQKEPNSIPLLFQTTHFNQHTCCQAQAANSNDTCDGSKSIIKFDTQVSSVTDSDLPPLVTPDHDHDHDHDQEDIIHNTIWNNDHESWFDFTIPCIEMKDEDETWLNPIISFNEMKGEDEFLMNPTVHLKNMNDEDGSSLNASVLGNGLDDDDDDDDDHDEYVFVKP